MATLSPLPMVTHPENGRRLTVDEFLEMSFEYPTDLVHGRIFTMPPAGPEHGSIALNIGMALKLWARSGDFGIVTTNDSSVMIDRVRHTVRGSDVAFTFWSSLPDRRAPKQVFPNPPALIAEVLSPTDRWPDVERKLHDYLEAGVKEVWVVDPEERTVWVHTPDRPHRVLSEADCLTSPLLPGFETLVAEFFRAD